MSLSASSCEIPGRPGPASGSRVLRFQPAETAEMLTGTGHPYTWQGVPVTDYKQAGDSWQGVARTALLGQSGEATAFHLRYFEIAPGGFTSLEKHAHEHAVVVLRGCGQVQLGNTVHDVGFGDTVYVAPHEAHQFRNVSAEPFGFLCIVDAQRDPPVCAVGQAFQPD